MMFQAIILYQKVKAFTCLWWFFVYCGWLGVIYDSQATNRSAAGERGALPGSSPFFLLVTWESCMTPSRTAMHFFYSHPD